MKPRVLYTWTANDGDYRLVGWRPEEATEPSINYVIEKKMLDALAAVAWARVAEGPALRSLAYLFYTLWKQSEDEQ
jgi:hypothetical protein